MAETRGKVANTGTSIDERPIEANKRLTAGHFEIDTVLSGKKKGSALITLTDRKSRLDIVLKVPNRTSTSVTKALTEFINEHPNMIKSIAADHGHEFAGYRDIKELDIPFYFAHPYSPHERGSNENANKFLRRYVPEHRPVESISEFELHDINLKLNLRPMKSLDWKTPLELFMAG